MRPSSVVIPLAILTLTGAAAFPRAQPAQDAPSAARAAQDPADRAAFMRQHFGLVMDVHHAVVSGDIDDATKHAQALANQPDPPGLGPAARPYITVMHRAASRAAREDDLDDVASATAAMLAACGDCHRAVGVMPAPPQPVTPGVGGRVGHMLAHEQAIDLMLQGLTVPSASAWKEGAAHLETAPLRRRDLPADRKLDREVMELEEEIHELAERAIEADDTRSRVYVYSELIQSCGTCHALHPGVWGPEKAGGR